MSKYKLLAPVIASSSSTALSVIKQRSIPARLKYLLSVLKNEGKVKSVVSFLNKNFGLELGALSSSKNDVVKATLKVKKAKAIAKAVVKKTAAKKVASKKTVAKKVSSKKVSSKKVATKKTASKKVVSKKVASKKVASKKVATKKVAAKKSK